MRPPGDCGSLRAGRSSEGGRLVPAGGINRGHPGSLPSSVSHRAGVSAPSAAPSRRTPAKTELGPRRAPSWTQGAASPISCLGAACHRAGAARVASAARSTDMRHLAMVDPTWRRSPRWPGEKKALTPAPPSGTAQPRCPSRTDEGERVNRDPVAGFAGGATKKLPECAPSALSSVRSSRSKANQRGSRWSSRNNRSARDEQDALQASR